MDFPRPEGFDDEDEYDSEDDLAFDYDEEDYYQYHHHGFDDLYDDVGEDYDFDVWEIHDQGFYVQDHEIVLYENSPETKEVEDLTVLDVLKVSDMTIKLVDALKLRLDLGSEELVTEEYRWIIAYCYLAKLGEGCWF